MAQSDRLADVMSDEKTTGITAYTKPLPSKAANSPGELVWIL